MTLEHARVALRWVLATFMVVMGVLHFVVADAFVATMPAALPAHLELVLISGVFEVLGGVGLLVPRTRAFAGWGLVALFVAVFPANVNMAVNGISPPGVTLDPVMLWARLPFQLVFVWVAWWTSRPTTAADVADPRGRG